jgi:molybdate transport system ATP-binding protein
MPSIAVLRMASRAAYGRRGRRSKPVLSARLKLHRSAVEGPGFTLDVSIEIPPGITILFGPSGAGKSTMLDCIAGLLRPDEGLIRIAGQALFDSKNNLNLPPQARRVAYVFQMLALFPHMTAEQNVAYGLANSPRASRAARVDQILRAFAVEPLRFRKPAKMSGGERQRIALARSLVTEPQILLLDEPLTGLDACLKTAIVEDLRAWNATHRIPVLYVTHNREEVAALGGCVIALEQGQVVKEGVPALNL